MMEGHKQLRLINFFIFNSTYSQKEGEEEKKILFFYPAKNTFDDKIRAVGLCEALIKFASTFSNKPIEVLHTQKTRKVFYEAAPEFWMVMTVAVPSERISDSTVNYKDEEVQDLHCLSVLNQSYDMFKLFMGPIASILQKSNVVGLKQRFEHFFNRYVYSITIDMTDILDVFHGLQFLPLDKNAFLKVQCYVNQIEAAFPCIRHTAFFYNDSLIWCGLDPDDMRVIYRYLTTSLFPAHPEQDPTRVSVKAKHMGRFIAGPPDLSKVDNFGKIPKLYLTGRKGKLEVCTLIVYRALHASMCFFLESSSKMPFDFYVTLDQMLGPELTQLAESISASYMKTSSLTSHESVNFKYVYFNHMNRALKSSLHSDGHHKTGALSVPSGLLRSILDVKVEMEDYISSEHCEVIAKTSHDNWIVAKKSDKREVYILIIQKNLNLIEVHGAHQFDPVPLHDESFGVQLDGSSMGQNVVLVKSGRRICGTGAALANTSIAQNKAYFEVKVQSTGVWGVGLATPKVNVERVPLGELEDSWVLREDSAVWHNHQLKVRLPELIQEGDVLGVSYDHIELNFFLNGRPMQCPVSGIKGTVYPAIYVDQGAILDVIFVGFYHQPPLGFSELMMEKQLL